MKWISTFIFMFILLKGYSFETYPEILERMKQEAIFGKNQSLIYNKQQNLIEYNTSYWYFLGRLSAIDDAILEYNIYQMTKKF